MYLNTFSPSVNKKAIKLLLFFNDFNLVRPTLNCVGYIMSCPLDPYFIYLFIYSLFFFVLDSYTSVKMTLYILLSYFVEICLQFCNRIVYDMIVICVCL